jgi:hypothetical protein
MLGFTKMGLAAAILCGGCESSGSGQSREDGNAAMATGGEGEAVTCEKCKITWRKAPVTNDKGRVVAYTTRKSHECPDCRNMVENFFTTGKMEHTCKTCGADAMEVCKTDIRRS